MTDQAARFAPDYAFPPGDTLREKLAELGMTQVDLAQRLDLSEKHVSHMMRGNAPLTYETAMALERITGLPASTWNALEARYRDHLLRQRRETITEEEKAWLAALPLADLHARGYIDSVSVGGRTLDAVLRFFAVADVKAWKKVWSQPIASFRRSAAHPVNAEATAVWLRIGEIRAMDQDCASFDAAGLRRLLPALRRLTQVSDFVGDLVKLCARVGIAVVLTPEVPGSRVNGAARWLTSKKALIQLSDRHKKDDIFWFSFFHEIGHLLLHSKKESYIHDGSEDGFVEEEANSFSRGTLIPPKWHTQMNSISSVSDIRDFAQRVGVSTSIVAGRLARDKINGWNWQKVAKLRNHLHIEDD